MSSDKQGVKEMMDDFFGAYIKPSSTEFIRLLPDGLVLGTGILYILSFCKSYGYLLLAMLELMILQRAFSNIIGKISPIRGGPNTGAPVCQTGFMSNNMMRISAIEAIGLQSYLPSPTMFFVSGVIAYMVGGVQEFKNEIVTLGGDISGRNTTVMIFSLLFLLMVFMFKIVYGCEEFGPLLLSLLLGGIMGYLVMYQNKSVFGRDSVNVLNLPMIVSGIERGKPMFVCGPSP
jgi:hypothetical protein